MLQGPGDVFCVAVIERAEESLFVEGGLENPVGKVDSDMGTRFWQRQSSAALNINKFNILCQI